MSNYCFKILGNKFYNIRQHSDKFELNCCTTHWVMLFKSCKIRYVYKTSIHKSSHILQLAIAASCNWDPLVCGVLWRCDRTIYYMVQRNYYIILASRQVRYVVPEFWWIWSKGKWNNQIIKNAAERNEIKLLYLHLNLSALNYIVIKIKINQILL